jgi:hypothetical protein
LGTEGEEALANKGWVKTCQHDNYTRGKKRLHLLRALDLPATLEAGCPLLLLLLWWWRWRWHRGTGAPLPAVGLRAGLLGPTSSPLALLGGPKQATHRRDTADVTSLPPTPPVPPRAEELLAGPLPLSMEQGATAGPALEAPQAGWGPQPVHQGSGSRRGALDRRSDELPHRSHQRSAAWPASPFAALDHHRAPGCPGGVSRIQG